MDYLAFHFKITPFFPHAEILIQNLADIGFDAFEENTEGFVGYVPKNQFQEEPFKALLDTEAFAHQYRMEEIPATNWNAVWESSFEPIVVADTLCIHAPFHENTKQYPLQVCIQPKMSFGTGHHATTYLMAEQMLKENFLAKKVLDMGSGTGILSILAEKLGAKMVLGIDIEPWAYENALENKEANATERTHFLLGDALCIPKTETYDFVLANINRNILLQDMAHYVQALANKGKLLLSGFLAADIELLDTEAKRLGLKPVCINSRAEWRQLTFEKE